MGFDHGGGQGAGAFAFYNLNNPAAPQLVLDSRNHTARYHTGGQLDYVGDWAEMHHCWISGDRMLMSERRPSSNGLSVFDMAAAYDTDPNTLPSGLGRMSYAGVGAPTNYEGYSFAVGWQGNRYAYAPTGAQGLYIIDTTNPANMTQMGHVSRSALGNQTYLGAWPIGNVLILGGINFNGLTGLVKFFDISNPASPVAISGGAFNAQMGYFGFVHGNQFHGAGSPIVTHDFTNPAAPVRRVLHNSPGFDRPEYGYGQDDHIFVGHYPGATRWLLNNPATPTAVTPTPRINSGMVDDHAFLNPAGNLSVLCTDHNNALKMIVGVATTTRDTTPPVARFVSPTDGAVNQHVLSRVGISFSDTIDPQTLSTGNIHVRNVSTGALVAGSFSSMLGIVNFVPDAPLAANTTYEVTLIAGGVTDQCGNAIPSDIRVTAFSTGNILSTYSAKPVAGSPVLEGSTTTLTATVTNPGSLPLEFSWDFGDGTPATAWSSSSGASHTWNTRGNFSTALSARVAGSSYVTATNSVQVVHLPLAAVRPASSTTIIVDPDRAVVWNVNPDQDTVTAIDTANLVKLSETPVGDHPVSLAIGSGDDLWVANKNTATLTRLRRADGVVLGTLALPRGSDPHGLVIDRAANIGYVSLEGTGQVAKLNLAAGTVLATLAVGPHPRGLALDPQRGLLLVSRFISPDQSGTVNRINLGNFTLASPIGLAAVMTPESLNNGRGIPNYLMAPALSPDLTQGWVPAKKDNIFRGGLRDGQPLTFESTVRSMAARLNLATQTSSVNESLDFDNSDFPTAAAFSPLGNYIYFATSGSQTIWVVDAWDSANRYSISSGGAAPDGLAFSADGSRLFVHNFLARNVAVLRSTASCAGVCGTMPPLASIATVANEALPAQVLTGKRLFYSTNDPRLAQEGYMSCASCHLDGNHDGRTWDFTSLGEGLRNTIDLKGRGVGHGPFHWSANFDEAQDFEGQIRGFAQGVGLMSDAAFHRGSRSLPLGEGKAGISADLDALAAYLASLTTAGRSPHRNADDSLTAQATAGRQIFLAENCASCHGGSTFTDSASFARHDVGTLTSASGQRLGGTLDGLDTPTLRGLWKSAPYLHDGSAAILRDVLVTRNPSGLHANLSDRSSVELDQLVAYLQSIDDFETTAPTTATGNGPVLGSVGNQSHPIGQALTLQLVATGSGLTWEAVGLPIGLSINGSGLVSGTPLAAGTYTARVAVRDAAGRFSPITFTWVITDPVARRYVKLVSLSSHNGQLFSCLADFTLFGTDGQPLDRSEWTATASSQETAQNNGAANAIDSSDSTLWHTLWSGTAFPHHLTIDLKNRDIITGFSCLPRQDGNVNGRIKDYEFYWSDDGVTWGPPIAQGSFPNNGSRQIVLLDRDVDGFSDYLELGVGTDPQMSTSLPSPSYAGLKAWWKLDEAGGASAINSAVPDHGTLIGSPARVAGLIGGGLEFNGSNQSVELPAPGINSNTVTLSAWVKRNGTQTTWAGIAFTRSVAPSGLVFGASNELRYHWNGAYYNFSSGLTVPDNTWTFCAMVIEPSKATFYMKPDGAPMQTAINNVTHGAGVFGGPWYLGQDPADGRFFKGQLDAARIYGRSLSATEIAEVAVLDHLSDEAPLVAGFNATLYDTVAVGTQVGTLAVTNAEVGDTHTWAIVAGNTGGAFAINPATGAITVAQPLDANVKRLYSLTVRATDSGDITGDATVKVSVFSMQGITADSDGDGYSNAFEISRYSDPNSVTSVPTTILAAYWNFDQSGTPSTFSDLVRTVQATPISGAVLSPAGTGRSGASGDRALDLGTAGTNTRAETSNVAWLNQVTAANKITISFWQKHETLSNNFSFYANSPSAADRGLGALTPYDGVIYFDTGGTATANRTSVAQPAGTNWLEWRHLVFVRNNDTAQIWLNGVLLKSETGKAALKTDLTNLLIGSGIGGTRSIKGDLDDFAVFNTNLTSAQIGKLAAGASPLTIDFPQVNPPTFVASPVDGGTIAEDAPTGTAVTTVSATDADPGDTIGYAITGGNPGNAFAINSATGEITVAAALNYEATAAYALTVTATDAAALVDTGAVNIAIGNVNEAPVFGGDPLTKPAGSTGVVYSGSLAADASDVDAGDTLTFSKVSGPAWLNVAANGALSGTPGTGNTGNNAFVVKVTDAASAEDTAALNITVNAALPAGWTVTNIGTVGTAGSSAHSGGTYSITASDTGYDTGTSDNFRFNWQTMSGDGEIKARITGMSGATSPFVSVMIRETTAGGSKCATTGSNIAGGIWAHTRATTGGGVASVGNGTLALPRWIRLVRTGNTFVSYRSSDGVNWTQVTSRNITMASQVLVGLAVTSRSTTVTHTATFDNVTVIP
ncbi:MAG: LamG-like jellyroll fold domain-containing protein [Verrucomicrobiota bacterium]